jgi:hypothetical protein
MKCQGISSSQRTDSTVSGQYTFEHADLNTIKGIGGMLSSVGEFKGRSRRVG